MDLTKLTTYQFELVYDFLDVALPTCVLYGIFKTILLYLLPLLFSLQNLMTVTLAVVVVQSLSCVQLFAALSSNPCSTPGFPIRHQLLELVQTHVHPVGEVI